MIDPSPDSRFSLDTCLDLLCNLNEDSYGPSSHKKSMLSGEFENFIGIGNNNSKKSIFSNSSFSRFGSFVLGRHISYCTSEDFEDFPFESSKDGTMSKGNSSHNQEESKNSNSMSNKQDFPLSYSLHHK